MKRVEIEKIIEKWIQGHDGKYELINILYDLYNSEMRRVLENLKIHDEVFNKTSMGKEMAYEIIVNRIDKELEGVEE
jgi:hypothetical protein